MLKTFLITLGIVALAVALLSLRIFVKGRWKSTHVSGNAYLAKRGIHCAQTQDREERNKNNK